MAVGQDTQTKWLKQLGSAKLRQQGQIELETHSHKVFALQAPSGRNIRKIITMNNSGFDSRSQLQLL